MRRESRKRQTNKIITWPLLLALSLEYLLIRSTSHADDDSWPDRWLTFTFLLLRCVHINAKSVCSCSWHPVEIICSLEVLSLVAIFRKPLLYKRPWSCRCRRSSWHWTTLVLGCYMMVSVILCLWLTRISNCYCFGHWSEIRHIHMLSIFLVVYCCNYGSTNNLDLVPSFTVILVKDIWWAFNVAAIV